MKCGVIGLGDMGSGLAKNLMKAGFETWGADLDPQRAVAFQEMGGNLATNAAEVGKNCDAVFVMVMNGDQARSVILGEGGLIVADKITAPPDAMLATKPPSPRITDRA